MKTLLNERPGASGAGETMSPKSVRLRSVILLLMVNILVTGCLAEVVLRVQQKLGPLYNLDLRPEEILIGLSDELNHVHPPGGDWDRNGFRKMSEPNAQECAATILFMGDSFMEGVGGGNDDTVPVHVRNFFRQASGKELCVFNAACSSYSPSIFVAQAKTLIPLVKPDLVVIDVDETDLYDDYYRYRKLATRDGSGSIVSIRPTPVAAQFQHGLIESTSKTLYLHRFIAKLYFTKITYPRSFARYYPNTDIVWASRLPAAEARQRYADAIENFDATLDDLTKTVLTRMGSADRLVYVHHPHLGHLKTEGDVFNDVVASTVREVASRHRVRFFDATESLKAQFGAAAESYYLPNDLHFNPAGTRAYGIAVAKYLAGSFAADSGLGPAR